LEVDKSGDCSGLDVHVIELFLQFCLLGFVLGYSFPIAIVSSKDQLQLLLLDLFFQ